MVKGLLDGASVGHDGGVADEDDPAVEAARAAAWFEGSDIARQMSDELLALLGRWTVLAHQAMAAYESVDPRPVFVAMAAQLRAAAESFEQAASA